MNLDDDLESLEETGVQCQTDVTMEELDKKFEQLNFASKKIEGLQQKIDSAPFGLMDQKYNDTKWKYFTGFPFAIVNEIIYDLIKIYIPSTSTTALSPFNQLLITLIKLRLDLDFKLIAYTFKISQTTAATYFENIIHILFCRLKSFIVWPEDSTKNIPSCFKEVFHDNTTVIVDCFEVFIEKPASLLTQQECWSNYKHHNTIKFLIGITPQGTICFISETWGGRVSDKNIFEKSNFCNFIKAGDVVLADRGFLVKETVGNLKAKLIVPSFTKGKSQLHPLEVEETRQLAHVRIHVERIIGFVKNRFKIFKGTIPISMLKKGNDPEEKNLLDKIVLVCCALIDISNPIIPL